MSRRRVKWSRKPSRDRGRNESADSQVRWIVIGFLLVAAILTAVMFWAVERVADGMSATTPP